MSVQRVEELWQMKAACRGPQATIFFPPAQFERKDEKEARESRAKSICAVCPVRRPCPNLWYHGYIFWDGSLVSCQSPSLTNPGSVVVTR